jgi:hypothetical protein
MGASLAQDDPQLPRLSRSLLIPGPLPPLSHFGVTLLRHVVGTALRYSCYQLGLPVPEAPPVRIVRLRLYLDADPLLERCASVPGGREVVAALLAPGGAGALPPEAGALAGACRFHRWRLAFPFLRGRGAANRAVEEPDAPCAWRRFRRQLSRRQGRLNDACLGEILASLARRQARRAGRTVPPCLGAEAWKRSRGRRCSLASLGPLDPRLPSWADHPGAAAGGSRPDERSPAPVRDRHRGSFREAYRALLSAATPFYRELVEGAVTSGRLGESDAAFFVPFDLAQDLAGDHQPRWLQPAVASNRREYETWCRSPCPADELVTLEPLSTTPPCTDWGRAPLTPLQ